MPPSQTEHQVSGAGSSRKLLKALLCFTEDRPTWTVAELSERLDLSVTSTYRYVALLREVGLLEASSGNGYRVTDLVMSLAAACEAARPPIIEIAMPIMTRIRDEVDETVLVARRGGRAAYCVDRVESQRPVRLQFDKGQAMSLHRGSMSRVLLASMSRPERAAVVAAIGDGMDPGLAAQLTDDALDVVHRDGWTESFEEIDEGIWGTAAAIVSHGSTVASIGTAAPIFRTDATRRARIISLIRDAASEISHALDGSGPS
ncbi:IclR family transcriptional regulator [Rhodococcus sp. CH91]|uniref:IclR family transcriptional regulator n=1 Tax=Rhodococcus sp. CH91 TaxID=2910256 RepID=UPI001F4AEB66|nr:IclR family transcriptional regulator [Rhodococcus sp. CH91]